jgi:hypothetical protein
MMTLCYFSVPLVGLILLVLLMMIQIVSTALITGSVHGNLLM